MSTIETRLTDRQATLAGIARVINKHLGRTPLARVELRYSTQADVPLAPQLAKQTIANLLREHGQGNTVVSVRAHQGPIDDATGEHVLRLTSAEPVRLAAAITQDKPPRVWCDGLAHGLARLFGRSLTLARVEPRLPAARPAVSRGEAVKKLREAVLKATAYVETDTGTAAIGGTTGNAYAVGLARVIVRLPGLHQALEAMVQNDTSAIANMVKSAGLALTPEFRVAYAFQPLVAGDGTGYANEADVEVRLVIGPVRARTAAVQAVASGTAHAAPGTAGTAVAGGTAMPAPTRQVPVCMGAMVRVLGTTAGPFARPFELPLASLPARFDRAALEAAGFGRAHPGLLAVASNSCPLLVRQGAGDDLELHASTRPGEGGFVQPMYFDPDTLAPLTGTQTMAGRHATVVVNAPGGVHDPVSGVLLPALLIEVVQRGGSDCAGESALQQLA